MRGNTGTRFPDKQLSVIAARAQFETWLACSTPMIIGRTTLDQLIARYRLPPRELETRLLAKQDQIRRQAAANPI